MHPGRATGIKRRRPFPRQDGLPDNSVLQEGMGSGPAVHLFQTKVNNQGLLTLPPGPRWSLSLSSTGLCNLVIVVDWLPPSYEGQVTRSHSVRHLGRVRQPTTTSTKGQSSSLMVSEANHLKILKYERCPLLFLKEQCLSLIWVSSSKGRCDKVIDPDEHSSIGHEINIHLVGQTEKGSNFLI